MLSVLLSGQAFAADSLQQVLDKVASADGPAPGPIQETGTTFSELEGEGSLLRLYKFPDKFHIGIAYVVASEDRTMIGAKAWNKRVPANQMSRGAIALQAARGAMRVTTGFEFWFDTQTWERQSKKPALVLTTFSRAVLRTIAPLAIEHWEDGFQASVK